MEDHSKKQLVKYNQEYVWHPFTQMQGWLQHDPLFIEKGEGNTLIDIEGNRYIDGVSSLWANVHGHNRKEINDALKKQIDKIAHTTMLGLANVPATALAKKLIDIAPGHLNKVFYSDSGATAVEVALKMAYQYWQQKENPQPEKKNFIHLKESYHGDTIGSVSLGGMDLFHKTFYSLLFETYEIPTPFYYHSDFNSEGECMDFSLNALKDLLAKKSNEIAGLFIEPYVQGAAGMIVFPKGFMEEVQALCKEFNILFIVDEVATGFGRTGKMFACDEDKLKPDIMALGKGITGGYLPLSATLATNNIYNAFLGEYSDDKTFFHGHTYTGNPLACSAALASLEIFEKDQTLLHLQEKIKFLEQELQKLYELSSVGDIRQKGFMVGIELVADRNSKKSFPPSLRMGHKVCMEARKHNVIIRPLGDVIILMPPLSITIEELKVITNAVYQSIINVVH